MSQKATLKRTQRRVYLFHGDGLIDLAMGTMLLSYVFAAAQGRPTFAGVWIVVLLPLLISIKSTITAPRVDKVDFSPAPNAERRLGSILIIVVLLVAVIVLFGSVALLRPDIVPPHLTGWVMSYSPIGVGAVLAGLLASLAWALGAWRLHAYGALAVTVFAGGYWLGVAPVIYVAALGSFILGCGALILFRFVRTYPASSPPA